MKKLTCSLKELFREKPKNFKPQNNKKLNSLPLLKLLSNLTLTESKKKTNRWMSATLNKIQKYLTKIKLNNKMKNLMMKNLMKRKRIKEN
jgi:tetrahydrodipicolinate N-succinyltransferase